MKGGALERPEGVFLVQSAEGLSICNLVCVVWSRGKLCFFSWCGALCYQRRLPCRAGFCFSSFRRISNDADEMKLSFEGDEALLIECD